eukprot:INCI6351.1.p1 GENE.INCI6351.1~~INCI6351.1.p1  ORF type:complete len:740 (+),score=129.45 INCI6351.1:170-2389(+)
MPTWDSRFHTNRSLEPTRHRQRPSKHNPTKQQRQRTTAQQQTNRDGGREESPRRPQVDSDSGSDGGGVNVTISEDGQQQSPDDLIAQAASLLGARRRLEVDIKNASDNGEYARVVNLVKQRETLNQLLKDVFAFADGNLSADAAGQNTEAQHSRPTHGQWWLDDDDELNQEPDARLDDDLRNGESKFSASDRTLPQGKAKPVRRNMGKSKKKLKLRKKTSVTTGDNARPSGYRGATSADNRRTMKVTRHPNETANDRTLRRPAPKTQTRPSTAAARSTSRTDAPVNRSSERPATAHGSESSSSNRGFARRTTKSKAKPKPKPQQTETQKRIQQQRVRQGYTFGVLANSEGLMQSAGAKSVHAPTIRKKNPSPNVQRRAPGPGDYNIQSKIGKGGFSMRSGTGRSRIELRTDGGAADYNVWGKLGTGGLGFSRAGANLRLWFHDGTWCFGHAKHVVKAHTRAVCAVYVESSVEDPAAIGSDAMWKSHKGRNRARAFGDRVKHPDEFVDTADVKVEPKFGKRKAASREANNRSRSNSNGKGDNNNHAGGSANANGSGDEDRSQQSVATPRTRSKKTKGPPSIIVSGFKGFHNLYNGEYIKDGASGKLNGRAVYRRVRGPGESQAKVPGPGEYNLWKDIAKNGKKAVICSRPETKHHTDSPGPSAYNVRDNPTPANGVFFGVGGRPKWARGGKQPGPGEYDPDGVWRSYKGPNGLMHTGSHQREPARDDGTPGPGQYLRHFY